MFANDALCSFAMGRVQRVRALVNPKLPGPATLGYAGAADYGGARVQPNWLWIPDFGVLDCLCRDFVASWMVSGSSRRESGNDSGRELVVRSCSRYRIDSGAR